MPIYEYQCNHCEYMFEKLVRQSGDKTPTCPECGSRRVTKQFSSFSATIAQSSGDHCSMGRCPSGACSGSGCPMESGGGG